MCYNKKCRRVKYLSAIESTSQRKEGLLLALILQKKISCMRYRLTKINSGQKELLAHCQPNKSRQQIPTMK